MKLPKLEQEALDWAAAMAEKAADSPNSGFKPVSDEQIIQMSIALSLVRLADSFYDTTGHCGIMTTLWDIRTILLQRD